MSAIESLLELCTELQEQRDEAASKLDDARAQAQEACSDAGNAEDYASNARQEADQADDYVNEAMDYLNEISGKLSEIEAAIRRLDPDASPDAAGSDLAHDIAKHKDQVMKYLKAGHSVSVVARHLKISETLVELIRRRETANV